MSVRQDALNLGVIDPSALKRAEAVVERLRWVYIRELAPEALDEMEAAVLGLGRHSSNRGSKDDGQRRDAFLRLCHDMKGQAGTFGLDLLTDFAEAMHCTAEAAPAIGERQADVLIAHIMAIRTALAAVRADPRGEISPDLQADLRRDLKQTIRKRFN